MTTPTPGRGEPPEQLGSRRRGPDDRTIGPIPEAAAEFTEQRLFSRQVALAYEREAIRLRRFRLDHPLPRPSSEPQQVPQAAGSRAPLPLLLDRFSWLWRRTKR